VYAQKTSVLITTAYREDERNVESFGNDVTAKKDDIWAPDINSGFFFFLGGGFGGGVLKRLTDYTNRIQFLMRFLSAVADRIAYP